MMDALKWIAAAIAATLYVAQVDGAAALDNVRPAADDAAATAPVSAEPRETSATFGDWVARCQRIGAAGAEKSVCEAAQTLVIKGQQAPIAQIAFGRSEGGSVAATVLLPINIAFDKGPLLGIEGSDENDVKLVFRRCLPTGCFAEGKVEAAGLTAYRGSDKPGRLVFTDASEHIVKFPFSFRGLAQALDEVNKHP